ncbi:MAG: hypothetical protein ACXU8U_11870 [Asticcacaulis sp.]
MILLPISYQSKPRGVARLVQASPVSEAWMNTLRGIAGDDVPAVIFKDAEVRVLSGRFHGLLGPISGEAGARPLVCEVLLKVEAEMVLPAVQGGLVYAIEGAVAVGRTLINQGQTGILDEYGDMLAIVAGGEPARVLVMTDL